MDNISNQIWEELLDYARSLYNESSFSTWTDPAYIEKLDLNENKLYIHLPSETIKKKWLSDLQYKLIELCYKYTGKDITIVFDSPNAYESHMDNLKKKKEKLDPLFENKEQQLNDEKYKQQIIPEETIKNSNIDPKYTFSNFIVSTSNEFAYNAARVAAGGTQLFNPLLIWGNTGLGKTHLIFAVANEALKTSPTTKTRYISCHNFVSEFINSIQNNTTDKLFEMYSNLDLLLIDDIQFLTKKDGTQDFFFQIFESIYNNDGQIIMTSDKHINDIPDITDRLRSRFSNGVTCDVQSPDFETRLAILEEKSKANDFSIVDEGLEYIASVFKDNIRQLEGVLKSLQLFAISNKIEQLTLNDVKSVVSAQISSTNKKNKISVSSIQKAVADYYNIKVKDLVGKSREASIVFPRHVAIYFTKELTNLSLKEIGKNFGNRDHTTILNSLKKINSQKEDADFKTTLNTIEQEIKN